MKAIVCRALVVVVVSQRELCFSLGETEARFGLQQRSNAAMFLHRASKQVAPKGSELNIGANAHGTQSASLPADQSGPRRDLAGSEVPSGGQCISLAHWL